ncbi:hypothetical protein E2562_031497 [Oryza meyeriana var. granulata]|uniref:Peptidase M16 N-terminal domain-containing protein n=1 Tax=Oryza meyeriana var. granulata TaxID=110450 RepID=A0A6G1ERN9_9ORYZ|nr:hypothetical protein E2562_031497 [Oryza meyeriana var. granulata]
MSRRSIFTFASTSVVKQSSGGLFGCFLGGSSSQLPPLDVPLPGITLPPPLPDFVEPSKTKITTLPNGIKIASVSSPIPAASVGLYIDCGSIYETSASSGTSHLLERMAFKSTTNRSHLRLVREVEAIGGNVFASASREQMSYTYDALKFYAPEIVEVLIDSVKNPAFLEWEVKEQLQKIKSEISEVSGDPHGLLMEALHSAGYSGALAKPLIASESAVNRLDVTILEEFVANPDFASNAVDLAAREFHEVATPGKVTQEQLDRAKEATKSSVLMDFESRMVASEDIGRQVLTYGERKSIEYFLKTVEEITLNDISSTAKKIISSPLTLASWGDVIHVPNYESVSRKFHSASGPAWLVPKFQVAALHWPTGHQLE